MQQNHEAQQQSMAIIIIFKLIERNAMIHNFSSETADSNHP